MAAPPRRCWTVAASRGWRAYSFATIAAMGGPLLTPQVTVLDRHGRFVARVDGWLDECALAVETDGRGKPAGRPGPRLPHRRDRSARPARHAAAARARASVCGPSASRWCAGAPPRSCTTRTGCCSGWSERAHVQTVVPSPVRRCLPPTAGLAHLSPLTQSRRAG
nr:hypothetical protein [Angustibacter aerolatus]